MKNNILNIHVLFSSILLLFIGVLNPISGKYLIPYIHGERVVPDDIFFRYFEFQSWAFRIPDYINIVFIILFLIFLYRNNFKNLHVYLYGFGMMYFLRLLSNLMTPFATPYGIDYSLVNTSSILWDSGYFFSGHTAFFTMIWLYVRNENYWFNFVGFFLLMFAILTILLGRHHYTIDIYGGLITGILVYELYVKKRLI